MTTALLPGLPPGYQLLAPVAQGLQAQVFQARRLADNQTVALKIWRAAPAGDSGATEACRRLVQEAQLLQRLRHPAVVAVLEAGWHEARPWLAMRWMPGGALSGWLAAAPRPSVALALLLGRRLAHALAHAHQHGVLHRDVKPANVLLDTGLEDACLADFGLAQWAAADTATHTGLWLATPAYAAPEQLLGAALSPAADLYALGVLLYEVLTGELPFQAHSLGRLLQQVAQQPAPDVRVRRPDVPPALAELLGRLLAKEPAQRPASAAALAAHLEQVP